MENPNCPVRLRKATTSPTKTKSRSTSIPRSSTIAERNAEQERQKSIILRQKQEMQRIASEKEEQELKDAMKMQMKRRSIIIPQRAAPAPKIWDDDGKLVEPRDEPAPPPSESPEDEFQYIAHMAPLSHTILEETIHKSLLEREMEKTKKRQSPRRKRSASVVRTDFDGFWERQDKLNTKRNNELKEAAKPPKLPSHIDKRSAILAKKAKPRPKPAAESELSCTFKPDLSLTQHVKASGISCVYNEARALMKEVEITVIKVEREAEANREYTLAPEFESSEKLREMAHSNRDRILKNNRDRSDRIASEVRKAQEEENRVEHVKCAKKAPKRTRRIHAMLEVLQEGKKTKSKSVKL